VEEPFLVNDATAEYTVVRSGRSVTVPGSVFIALTDGPQPVVTALAAATGRTMAAWATS
jgi:hypothetical protein